MSSAAQALPRQELVLDRYRPLRPLGSGGSGSVWLARDERTGLEVALKIIAREGKAADRAEREAEAASRLRHERCLRAYGFGSDSGHVYIAYEYVGGCTLREAMRGGELRDGQAVEAAAQILDGLAHAHARGIVHRDVKPSNVLLAEGDGISVRLLDFGLAQFDEAETLTAVGDVPGTLAYISPERLRGEEACPASDIWGVGILLWEALAGKHPFWGVPLQQMAGTIETGAPSLHAERPDLPKRLLTAIGHALANDPKRRPSAAALAKELRSALGDRRRVPQRVHVDMTRASLLGQGLPAAAAFATTLAGATMLPFFPAFWAPAFAVAAAGLALRAPRAGLALALAAPILPLGNVALGLALLYGAIALGWLALSWGDARRGLTFLAGPLLAPLGLIALVPLAVQVVRGPVRRGAQAVAAVAVAALVAGLRGTELPFGQGTPDGDRRCRHRERRECRDGARGRRSCGTRARRPRPRRDRRRNPVRPHTVADRGPRRRGARGHDRRRAGGAGAAPRRRRLADLPRSRGSGRALEFRPGEALDPDLMSVLRTIEQKIEGLFEGMFGRAFRTHVQPVELARKLAKEMDEHRTISVSRVYVPNEYSVYLSESDREQFTGYEGSLIGELQDYLIEHARRESYAMLTPPKVLMLTDADLSIGEFGIATRMVQPEGRRGPQLDAPAPQVEPGATMIYKAKAPQPTEAASPVELGVAEESFSLKMNGRNYAIDGAKAVLGRSKDCDVQVEDGNVSRRHAELRREGSTWWLVDLDSTNGTELNGKRVQRAKLSDGDTITLGATDLVFGVSSA